MNIRKILSKEDSFIMKVYSHQDLDTACFEEFGHRPYKLGETKSSKIKKLRNFVEGLNE